MCSAKVYIRTRTNFVSLIYDYFAGFRIYYSAGRRSKNTLCTSPFNSGKLFMRTSNLLFESPTVPKKSTPDSGDGSYFFTSHIHIQIITFSFRSIQCWNINYICLVRKPWFDLICLSLCFCLTCILFLSVTCPKANKESVGCRYYRW